MLTSSIQRPDSTPGFHAGPHGRVDKQTNKGISKKLVSSTQPSTHTHVLLSNPFNAYHHEQAFRIRPPPLPATLMHARGKPRSSGGVFGTGACIRRGPKFPVVLAALADEPKQILVGRGQSHALLRYCSVRSRRLHSTVYVLVHVLYVRTVPSTSYKAH